MCYTDREGNMETAFEQLHKQVMIARKNHNYQKPDFIVLGGKKEQEVIASIPIDMQLFTLSSDKIKRFMEIEIVFSNSENEMCVCYKG